MVENLFRGKETFVKVLCGFYIIRLSSNIVRNNHRIDLGSQVYYLFQDDWNPANSGSHEPANFGKLKESQFISLDK
jgi:hypothetical protein